MLEKIISYIIFIYKILFDYFAYYHIILYVKSYSMYKE